MFIDEKATESGIEAISVVDAPAIELDFVALNKQKKVELVEVDKEKRILMGAILVPNKPIYRKQEDREFYIHFSKDTVRKGMELFFKKGFQNNATEQHESKLSGCTLVESWIKEDEVNDKSVKYGLSAPIGAWMGSMKIDDEETYQKAKRGELSGFSIEGYFTDKLTMKSDEIKTENSDTRLLDMKNTFKTIMEAITGKSKKTELEQIKSADGSVVFDAVSFEAGQPINFLSDGESIPVPAGNYELENGAILVVEEDGVIASYTMEGETPETPEKEQEMETEQTAKKVVESQTKETHFEKEAEVVEVIFTDQHKAALKEAFLEFYQELKAQEETTEEVEETKAEEKEELAEVAQPMKHSPEKKVEQERKISFGNNKHKTVKDRVFAKLNS